MNGTDRMIKVLEPLNLYSLKENTNVFRELKVYGEELDLLKNETDILLREEFIRTAESYGLDQREKVFCSIKQEIEPLKRQEMLLMRGCISDNDFSVKEFKKSIESFGADSFTITEYFEKFLIVVEIDGVYCDRDIAFIKNEIEKICPAHQKIVVYFGGVNWEDFEKQQFDFLSMDNKNLTFDQIDEMKL